MRGAERARQVYGEEHIWIAEIYSKIALTYYKKGNNQLASTWIRRSFIVCHKSVGEGHKALTIIYVHLQKIESARKSVLVNAPIESIEYKIRSLLE